MAEPTNNLTLAFSTHRPETLPYAAEAMRGFRAVALEEPKHPGFRDMLDRSLSIDAYLRETEFEYPAFARGLCRELRNLASQGIALYQVDPFMDELAAVHERFAAGESPEDIEAGTAARSVYEAEKDWTAALIDFYRKSVTAAFRDVVEAVKRFARQDAARGRLRDAMRANALVEIARGHANLYVETGYIHQYLPYLLKRALPPKTSLTRLWLMAPVVRELTGKTRALGPGDALTVACTFKPDFDSPAADLLAARSLIHVKALAKEEIEPTPDDPAPHTRDEIEVSELVSRLSFEDCRRLYERMRGSSTTRSRAFLDNFTAG
jgi:hypothetical protein